MAFAVVLALGFLAFAVFVAYHASKPLGGYSWEWPKPETTGATLLVVVDWGRRDEILDVVGRWITENGQPARLIMRRGWVVYDLLPPRGTECLTMPEGTSAETMVREGAKVATHILVLRHRSSSNKLTQLARSTGRHVTEYICDPSDRYRRITRSDDNSSR